MNDIMTYEQMNYEANRLEIIDTCHNMVTQYAFEHSNGCDVSRFFNKMWSKRDDVVHVMPWGVEVTREANEYNSKKYDLIYTPEIFSEDTILAKGGVFYHTITTRVIEVADDLQSCRICYLSPGHETTTWPIDMSDPSKGEEYSKEWSWSKYGWDFILEDGQWKVFNMRVYPVFKCTKDIPWTDTPALDASHVRLRPGMLAGPDLFQYTSDVIVPADEPEPPLPYPNLESTGRTKIGVGYAAVEPKEAE